MHHFIPPLPTDEVSPVPLLNPEHTLAIKKWVREVLRLDDAATVSVNELACQDADCPLVETVIIVFDESPTRSWKFTRSRFAVTKLIVQQALASSTS